MNKKRTHHISIKEHTHKSPTITLPFKIYHIKDRFILPATSSPLKVNTEENNKISKSQQDPKSRYYQPLNCMLTNARSLRNKIFDLKLLINTNNYDIISITESWTNLTKTHFHKEFELEN